MSKKQTPFEEAVKAVEAGTLKTPTVSIGKGNVPYFMYQLAVHKFNLKIMSGGMLCRGIKLNDIKKYYGLKGRTAKDILPQFLELMDEYETDSKAE